MAKQEFFKDPEDQRIYLEMLEDMDFDTAMDIYKEIEDETINDTHLSGKARNKPFSELTYKNLRYLVLGCKHCDADLRAKALATFIYRASLPPRFNALMPNAHLLKMLRQNLKQTLPQLYEWVGLKYGET